MISSYPIEVESNENVLNASHILNHSESLVSEENLERIISDNCKLLQLASSAFLDATRSQSNMTDTSFCKHVLFTLLCIIKIYIYIK